MYRTVYCYGNCFEIFQVIESKKKTLESTMDACCVCAQPSPMTQLVRSAKRKSRVTCCHVTWRCRVLLCCRCDECMCCFHFKCLTSARETTPRARGYAWYCDGCQPEEDKSVSASHILHQIPRLFPHHFERFLRQNRSFLSPKLLKSEVVSSWGNAFMHKLCFVWFFEKPVNFFLHRPPSCGPQKHLQSSSIMNVST